MTIGELYQRALALEAFEGAASPTDYHGYQTARFNAMRCLLVDLTGYLAGKEFREGIRELPEAMTWKEPT